MVLTAVLVLYAANVRAEATTTVPLASVDSLRARIALLVANSYIGTPALGDQRWPALGSTVADARRLKSALISQGFVLVGGDVHVNATQQQMVALADEAKRLANARPGAIVLFYFSGHGLALDGLDYLVPADAGFPTQGPEMAFLLPMSSLLGRLAGASGASTIVLVDACRSIEGNTQFGALASDLHLPERTFVGYATTLGASVVSAASGSQPSNFASALSDAIETAGPIDSLETVYYRTTRMVINDTRYQQRPVFRTGPGMDAGTLAPFRRREAQESASSATTLSPESAHRYLLRRCFWPAVQRKIEVHFEGRGDETTNALESGRADIMACITAIASARPDLVRAAKDLRLQSVDMAMVVSQAAEDGDTDAILMTGLSDFNNTGHHGRLFQPSQPGDPPPEAPDERMRATGWDNILRAARMGNTRAQVLAGGFLVFGAPARRGGPPGTFPPRDAKFGIELLERAEQAGNGEAAAYLAAIHLSGAGVPKSEAQARLHARRLTQSTVSTQSEQVDKLLFALGLNCTLGLVSNRDAACADELFSWLADRARTRLDDGKPIAGLAAIFLVQMREPPHADDRIVKLEPNDAATRYYLDRALALDLADGHFYKGLFHEAGSHGYPKDRQMALDEYRIAAARGYSAAETALRRLSP